MSPPASFMDDGLLVRRSGQASKRKFEVYVCTAADRPWALEAWRLLDPHGDLIPHDQRPRRLVVNKEKKCLAQALDIGRLPFIHGEPVSVCDHCALRASSYSQQLLRALCLPLRANCES